MSKFIDMANKKFGEKIENILKDHSKRQGEIVYGRK